MGDAISLTPKWKPILSHILPLLRKVETALKNTPAFSDDAGKNTPLFDR
jgi:hypothetical protein